MRDRLVVGSGPVVGTIVTHDRDADQPRERGLADLEFVEPRHDAIEWIVDLDDVERDRRGRADGRDVVMASQPLQASVTATARAKAPSTVGNQTMRMSRVYISE